MFNTCFGLSAEYIIDTTFEIDPASQLNCLQIHLTTTKSSFLNDFNHKWYVEIYVISSVIVLSLPFTYTWLSLGLRRSQWRINMV